MHQEMHKKMGDESNKRCNDRFLVGGVGDHHLYWYH